MYDRGDRRTRGLMSPLTRVLLCVSIRFRESEELLWWKCPFEQCHTVLLTSGVGCMMLRCKEAATLLMKLPVPFQILRWQNWKVICHPGWWWGVLIRGGGQIVFIIIWSWAQISFWIFQMWWGIQFHHLWMRRFWTLLRIEHGHCHSQMSLSSWIVLVCRRLPWVLWHHLRTWRRHLAAVNITPDSLIPGVQKRWQSTLEGRGTKISQFWWSFPIFSLHTWGRLSAPWIYPA